ncbi:MAG: DUF4326 domain-containing protein [Porphyrobacter sp.]|nr:DUF4326 domain-containing protein [Porphyrobacter sp.]
MPDRVQLSRRRGWRMPPNTVKVDRTTRWGNPYAGGSHLTPEQRAYVTGLFNEYLQRPDQADEVAAIRDQLRGKNLACWCPLDGPCHADVLLNIANGEEDQ